MDDDTRNDSPPALDALPFLTGTLQPPDPGSASAPAGIFDLYPRSSDVELLGALRFLLDVEGFSAAWLEARADLDPGAVDALLSGQDLPSEDAVRRLCRAVGMSRWLFFLLGSVQYGADLGLPELQWLIAERRRALAGDESASLAEIVAEATRTFFKLGARCL